ncbi:MAG: hypothetical protein QNJ91_10395 [Gammaproteobacteria bacterium]|nr:hypothetical protein [Gammaproteobacteria bacterium]
MSQTMLVMLGALAAEVVLLALLLLGIAAWRSRAQRKRDIKAARTLVARIKNGKGEREQTIVEFLEQGMGLSGEALDRARVAVLRAELGLLQRVAGVYRLRDAGALARIDDDLFAATAAYHALTGGGVVIADAPTDAASGDDAELEHLRNENQRLSEELTITMETMSRMLNEYSTMFAGSEPDDAMPISATAAATATATTVDDAAAETPDDAQPTASEVAPVDDADPDAMRADDEAEIVISSDPGSEPFGVADGDDVDAVPDDGDVAAEPDDGDGQAAAADGAAAAPEVAEPPALDGDDEIAAILREAQSQEASARAEGAAADAPAAAADIDVVVDADGGEGDAEAVAVDDADAADDLEALFDAVDGDVPEPADDPVDAAAGQAADAADVGAGPRSSQSGG